MSEHRVTIAGSYRKHFDRIIDVKRRFEQLGVTVLRPQSEVVDSREEELVRLEGDPSDARAIQAEQLAAIARSDLLYVVVPGGYLGSSTTLEVGYAHRAGTPVVTSEQPFEAAVGALISAVGDPETALTCLEGTP